MSVAPAINQELLERAEKFARENSISVAIVIEQALSTYLAPRTDQAAPPKCVVNLPVSTTLKLTPEAYDMSYGF